MNRPLIVVCAVALTAILTVTVAAQNAKRSRQPASPPSADSSPAPRKKQSRQAYRDEVTRLINEAGLACKDDSDCNAIPLGTRICGGAAEYAIISRTVTAQFGDRLTELQATIEEMDRAQQKESGMMGICSVLEKPIARCLKSLCAISN
ncbi:MAG: hypothetical protein IPJ84_10680 [Bdellovibrionales bacterium]|nr:hypothetical protein [Bdellovibrionales bacterium]